MDILVTGASGFLGRNFLLHAPANRRTVALYCNDVTFPEFVKKLDRPNIIAVRCDLNDPDQVRAMLAQYGRDWDMCLYLACKVDIPWSVREPRQDLLTNTGALLTLMEPLRAEKFVYFSSGAIYDGLEGEVRPAITLNPTLPYAISKQACERYVEFFHHRRRSIEKYLNVRFFGAYGPYEATHKIYTRLVRAFAEERRTTYTIYGDGRNLIDAMFVDDAVEAIRRIIEGDHWNDTVNLAGGRPLTIEALVREAAAAFGVSDVVIQKEGIANESNRFWGSTTEMRDFYGFVPAVSLAEGMTQFASWHLAHRVAKL